MPIYDFKCLDCGEISNIFFRSFEDVREKPACEHCGSSKLHRQMPRTGLIRVTGGTDAGELRRVDGRKAVENLGRQYDSLGIDPGSGFSEIARKAAKGESPGHLKEIVKEAKKDAGLT